MRFLEIQGNPHYIGDIIVNHTTTIRCIKGSRVDEYCKREGYMVEYLEEEIDEDTGKYVEEQE